MGPGLDELLLREPYRYEFFQAMRILERLAQHARPIGGDFPPNAEGVRLKTWQSLVFPPSEVVDLVAPGAPGEPWRVTVAFMGLTGPSGALPRFYTEYVLARAREHDFTLRDFLDLFNHRFLSLFYRAWEKYRFWLANERAMHQENRRRQAGPEAYRDFVLNERPRLDQFSQSLLDLAGLGAGSLRYRVSESHELAPRHAIDDEALRYYAGHLSQRHRSALGLEQLLSDYFGIEVVVEQLSGQWLPLDSADQTCLLPSGGNTQLGFGALIGERVWDVQSKFRIRLGPLGIRQFRQFLPSGDAHVPLVQLTRLYVRQQFDFDVQLILARREVPPCELNGSGAQGVRLGWETWIRAGEIARDVRDAVFSVQDG